MSDRRDEGPPEHGAADPFAPVSVSPRFATLLAVAALVLAGVGLTTSTAPLLGPIGMAVGLIAHLKGSRLGFPSTVVCGVATVVGMALIMYLR